ncbi:adrenodoxin-NADP+ reductase [Nematocida sp. LUAm3]|nr:adrenodoxin-NADP+ reductase [Nematocida sp. LUAm3]KAI5173590.1 adrenodoxin-NADP+ reductase [Nematocida sp. LUAm2]KAI5176811.1 adrenodoxin-NADP+ reductase [Nematocida sp. LUAm1]
MRICIVGGGAASGYLVREIVKGSSKIYVDVLEKTRETLGYLRRGVAPDEEGLKRSISSLEKAFVHPRVTLVRGVEVGKDISLREIEKYYDAFVIAAGSGGPKHLSIPGAKYIIPGDTFMQRVNGVPYVDIGNSSGNEKEISSLTGRVAIIGHGNVSLDCARMLLSEEVKRKSEYLRGTSVNEVSLIGRGTPFSSSFTSPVLSKTFSLPIQIMIPEKEIKILKENQNQVKEKKLEKLIKAAEKTKEERDKGVLRGKSLNFLFEEEPVEVIKEAEGYSLITKDKNEKIIIRKFDHILSSIGYSPINIEKLIENVTIPVYSIGWSKSCGKGDLSDAAFSAIECHNILNIK